MLLAPIIWVLTVGIVYFFAAKIWWFPPPINQHGMDYDAQFMRTLIVVGVVFTLAQLALGWVIMKFRNDGGKASHSHGNNALETLWTSATAILFLGLVVMGTKIWAGVHFDEAPPDAIPIEVMAKQFAWNFRYPGPDGKFGHTDLQLVNDAGGNPFGLDDKDPAGKDDIVSASLKVPVGKHIKLILHSRDVIHNFFVPRAPHETGHRAGHGDPPSLPGRQDRHLRSALLGTVRAGPFSDAHHHAGDERSGFRAVETATGGQQVMPVRTDSPR